MMNPDSLGVEWTFAELERLAAERGMLAWAFFGSISIYWDYPDEAQFEATDPNRDDEGPLYSTDSIDDAARWLLGS